MRSTVWVWIRREIENYFCSQATLEAYACASASADQPMPLFVAGEADKRQNAMREAIREIQSAMETLGKGSPWSTDTKVSDDFLDPVFRVYFQKLGLPNLMNKKNFHELAQHIPENEIAYEVREKLNAIVQVAESVAEPEPEL